MLEPREKLRVNGAHQELTIMDLLPCPVEYVLLEEDLARRQQTVTGGPVMRVDFQLTSVSWTLV